MAARDIPRQLREVHRLAVSQRWTVENAGGHLRWTAPDGRWVTTPASKMSDGREVQNYIGRLRRAGLEIPNRGGVRKGKAYDRGGTVRVHGTAGMPRLRADVRGGVASGAA